MDAREGSTRRGAPGTARGAASARRSAGRPTPDRRPDRGSPAPAGEGLVIGGVPVLARVAGALLALAGLAGVVAPFPAYLVVGGTELAQATGVGSVLVALLLPLVTLAVGAGLAAGAIPRFGLAFAGVGGSLTLGLLLIELYRGSASTTRPGVEVIAGERVLTSSVELRPGWVLGVVALSLSVLAGCCAVLAWGRTVMEDSGALDPARPVLAGTAVLLGVGTVLCLVLPAADVPDRIVTDPATGLQTVVEREGPQALLERPGLALLGGLLLAGALVLGSVLAPSLRPRLAAVGALLALTVVVLSAGLQGLRDALVSDELEWTVPGAGLLVAGLGYAGLTALAWRLRRRPVAPAPGNGSRGSGRGV